jgi:hypothetical protein
VIEMRKSTLLLLVATVACGERESGDYVVIEDFLARSPLLACRALPSPEYLAVTALRTASDSTVLVMDGPSRRLVELDASLRPVWEMEAPSAGPGAVNSPVAMAVLGDTAVAIAERQGLQLIVYARSGELIRTTPLGFAPSGLAALPSGVVLVTAMPFGDTPGTLLLRYDEAGFQEMDLPPRPYPDMIIGALGNTTLAEAFPDGAALVMHQFMAPRAFRVGTDGRAERLRVPTPDATRESIDYIPTGRIMEEQIERMLVPASAMSVDPTRSEIYVLTRSGRRVEGGTERAILRLDDRLGLLESFTLSFMARHIAYLPREQIALLVDDEDRFHACDFRRPNGHARAD